MIVIFGFIYMSKNCLYILYDVYKEELKFWFLCELKRCYIFYEFMIIILVDDEFVVKYKEWFFIKYIFIYFGD